MLEFLLMAASKQNAKLVPPPSSSDLEKIMQALGILNIRSVDDLLAAVGLETLPTAQRYGILFGCLTFVCTVGAVLFLLVKGGSFQRMAEQSVTGGATVADATTIRRGRPLLLERLLEAREYMMNTNYPGRYQRKPHSGKHHDNHYTALTRMLLTVAPAKEVVHSVSNLVDEKDKQKQTSKPTSSQDAGEDDEEEEICLLQDEDDKENTPHQPVTPPTPTTKKPTTKKSKAEILNHIPPGYEANYLSAYRRCQDRPGGGPLSGRPEAHFEAYARAYAGCGTRTSTSYRRSYARLYEAVACRNHEAEAAMSAHFESRPWDLVGRTVRLEPLEVDRHVEEVYKITSGDPHGANHAFDPQKIWAFLDCGPFQNASQLAQSSVFCKLEGEAAFAVIEALTDRVMGIVSLSNDDPKNLSIQLDLPLMMPSAKGTVEEVEACFLLLDRLFALGYRRIQMSVDSQDALSKKVPGRLGFTQEGLLLKHLIVKEASRDSCVYGMLNSDWTKGARKGLFGKLHGVKAQKVDEANGVRDGEWERQQEQLKEKKEKEKEGGEKVKAVVAAPVKQ